VFEIANHIEAGLWIAIGIAFACFALTRSRVHMRAFAAAIVFVLFGGSDIVEAQTGAWWHTWWLLCWKALCVLAMLILFLRHKLGQVATEDLGDGSTAFARIVNPIASSKEITADTECIGCGYNLRGLTAGGNCPECGRQIQSTLRALERLRVRGEYLLLASYAAYFVSLIASIATRQLSEAMAGIPVFVGLGIIAPIILALAAISMYFAGPKTRGVHVYLYLLGLAITGFLYVQFCLAAFASA